jgi:hypothetical protein
VVRTAVGEVIPACTAALVQGGAVAVPGVCAAAIGRAHAVPGGRRHIPKACGTAVKAYGTAIRAYGTAVQCGGHIAGACGTAVGQARRDTVGRPIVRPGGIQHAVGEPVARPVLLLRAAPPLGLVSLEFVRDRREHTLPQVF